MCWWEQDVAHIPCTHCTSALGELVENDSRVLPAKRCVVTRRTHEHGSQVNSLRGRRAFLRPFSFMSGWVCQWKPFLRGRSFHAMLNYEGPASLVQLFFTHVLLSLPLAQFSTIYSGYRLGAHEMCYILVLSMYPPGLVENESYELP